MLVALSSSGDKTGHQMVAGFIIWSFRLCYSDYELLALEI